MIASGKCFVLALRCVVIALLLSIGFSAIAAAQKIPALLDLPSGIAASNPDLVQRRAELMQQRTTLHANIDEMNARCASVLSGSVAEESCHKNQAELLGTMDVHIQECNEFNTATEVAISSIATKRTYRPSGSALIGGTTWITGFNIQSADSALAAKEHEMMAAQMKLAGKQYSDGVDFKRYNFVLGIAAYTTPFLDLASRVVFDEFSNGKFSAAEQAAYNSLKGRQFDELACHSNGAMVCLAALENKDVMATRVTLYGPQLTVESLKLWDEFVRSGRVASVQIFINRSDPVPPVSLLTGGGFLGTAALSSLATFKPPTLVNIIHQTSPRLTVQTFNCGAGIPTLDCHAMTAYKAHVTRSTPTDQSVPGTKLHGVGTKEPPPPSQ
jgi:hypothetical protein